MTDMIRYDARQRRKSRRRATLSVSARLYAKLEAYSRSSGEPVSRLIERLLRPILTTSEDK